MTEPCWGPLSGVRVIEIGTLISGPFAGRLLGDMGADVIKIEPPGQPDPLRTWGQAELDGEHFFWTVHARNKKAVTLNLREPRGRELFLELVEHSDIIVENFRPGTLEKWNLGYDVLRERNRGIILVRVSGYGQTGPEAGKAGYAIVFLQVTCAVTGLLDILINDLLPPRFHMTWARSYRHIGYIAQAIADCAYLMVMAKQDTFTLLALSYALDATFAVFVAAGTVARNQKSRTFPNVDRRKART